MPTSRNPTPDPVETVQAEFVKISNEEAPLPLTRIVIAEEALNPIFETPLKTIRAVSLVKKEDGALHNYYMDRFMRNDGW
jgi:hypothetical protein